MSVYQVMNIGKLIENNPYVGRGIVLGKSADGSKAVLAYFIMGRSENSRNRVFLKEKDNLVIHPFDASKVQDPSLIIYTPVCTLPGRTIVTNGDQTDTVRDFILQGKTFEQALDTRGFEPDAPNYTPRISGIICQNCQQLSYKLNILKSADEKGSACNRFTYTYTALSGIGHFIHTYQGDGNPLPTFQGEPTRVEIPCCIDELTTSLWENLNEENKISLYVRYTDLQTGTYQERLLNKNA